jgi:LysR family transcriptional regulator, regulator for bpeEF and oprC
MDRLRALQYFIAAAEEHSFTGAARRLEVSIPAVAKLVAAFERELGARLFDRTPQGLTLTADGENYLEACRPVLEQLAAADEALTGAAARPRGVVVVGIMAQLMQHCILPALPRFHARYPDIQIDIRVVNRVADVDSGSVDLFVLMGWPEHPDLVHRRIAQTRQFTCAAPAYWAAHGIPKLPRDLEHHVCLAYRNPQGTVIDLWQYERGAEVESVAVSGWLTSNHRDVILDLVLAGEGVARISDLSSHDLVASGRLVPVFPDWEMQDAPPVNLLYRPNHRRTPRVRLFIDFLVERFQELEAEREHGTTARSAERPDWYGRRSGRASTTRRRA